MSDALAYQVAADLTDFLSDQVATITMPSGYQLPDRIFTSYGETDPRPCPGGEIAVWIPQLSPTDLPNREATPDQTLCAASHYVALVWRLTVCISKSATGRDPIPVAELEAEAEALYTLGYALYRRIMVNMDSIWTAQTNCNRIGAGALDFSTRQGGQMQATQELRVGIDLTDPDDDSS